MQIKKNLLVCLFVVFAFNSYAFRFKENRNFATIKGAVQYQMRKINGLVGPFYGLGADVYPLHWLSVGGLYVSGSKYKNKWDTFSKENYRVNISAHAAPIFELLKWDYCSNHVDVYIKGFVETQKIRKELFGLFDFENNVFVELESSIIQNQIRSYKGYGFGGCYYLTNWIGLTAECGWINHVLSLENYFQLGINLRLSASLWH